MCEPQPVCEVQYPYDIMITNLQHANNPLLQNSAVLVGQSEVAKNIQGPKNKGSVVLRINFVLWNDIGWP